MRGSTVYNVIVFQYLHCMYKIGDLIAGAHLLLGAQFNIFLGDIMIGGPRCSES